MSVVDAPHTYELMGRVCCAIEAALHCRRSEAEDQARALRMRGLCTYAAVLGMLHDCLRSSMAMKQGRLEVARRVDALAEELSSRACDPISEQEVRVRVRCGTVVYCTVLACVSCNGRDEFAGGLHRSDSSQWEQGARL